MAGQKILVTQTRSGINREKSQKVTLKCLGLRRVGHSCEHTMTPSVEGMLRKVRHLVSVEAAKS